MDKLVIKLQNLIVEYNISHNKICIEIAELKAELLKYKKEQHPSRYYNTDTSHLLIIPPPQIITEDLGKIFEMAICLLYDTKYDGSYKYSLKDANVIKARIIKLKEHFQYEVKHIAKNGNKYDFIGGDIYLSAKTTKGDGKVCPQVIGQPSKKRFCEYFGINLSYSLSQIKKFIENNVHTMLKEYFINTFHCPIVYYNKRKDILLFIELKYDINWLNSTITFTHITKNKNWNESSSVGVKISGKIYTIGEFQVHNNRNCIKFRWAFERLLSLFSDNFKVQHL
jgi:hypothetical protein